MWRNWPECFVLVLTILVGVNCGGGSKTSASSSEPPPAPTPGQESYSVEGEIAGIGEGDQILLSVNGSAPTGFTDGPFELVSLDNDFQLAITGYSKDDIRCDISRPSGTRQDATGVAITCHRVLLLSSSTVVEGDTDASRSNDILLTFSREIDPASLDAISLLDITTDARVMWNIELSEDDPRTVILSQPTNPALQPLMRNQDYELKISTQLRTVEYVDLPQLRVYPESSTTIGFNTDATRQWRSHVEYDALEKKKVVGALDMLDSDYALYTTNGGLYAIRYDSSGYGSWDHADAIQLLTPSDLGYKGTVDDWKSSSVTFQIEELGTSKIFLLLNSAPVEWRHIDLQENKVISSGTFSEIGATRASRMSLASSPDGSRIIVNLVVITERNLECRPDGWIFTSTACFKQDVWQAEWGTTSGMTTATRLHENLILFGTVSSQVAVANDGAAVRATRIPLDSGSGTYYDRLEVAYRLNASDLWQVEELREMAKSVTFSSASENNVELITANSDTFQAEGVANESWKSQDILADVGVHLEGNLAENASPFLSASNAGFDIMISRVAPLYADETFTLVHLRPAGDNWATSSDEELVHVDANSTADILAGWNPETGEDEWFILSNYVVNASTRPYGVWISPSDSSPDFAFYQPSPDLYRPQNSAVVHTQDGRYHVVWGSDAYSYPVEANFGWATFD